MEKVNYRNGLIVFSQKQFRLSDPKTWFSPIIRRLTKSMWSHAAILMKWHGEVFVIDSDFNFKRNGVGATPWSEWIKNHSHVCVFDPGVDAQDGVRFLRRVVSKVGVSKYDKHNFIEKGISALGGNTPTYDRMPKYKHEQAFQCAEYVAWCYEYPTFYDETPESLFSGRLDVFNNGFDIYLGVPQNIEWIRI